MWKRMPSFKLPNNENDVFGRSFLVSSTSLFETAFFAIALAGMRTQGILGEKADSKQSTLWAASRQEGG